MILQHTTGAGVMRGLTGDEDVLISLRETPVSLGSGTTSAVIERDSNLERYAGTLTANTATFDIGDSLVNPGYQLINQTPGIISLDNGAMGYVANGEAIVDVVSHGGTRRYSRTISTSGQPPNDRFVSFVAGSLGKHIEDAITALVSGKTPGQTTMNLFTTNNYSPTAPSVTRNPDVFTAILDLSPISVVNGSTYVHPGLLISPRHIIGASHYQTQSPVVFQRADGSLQTVGISSRKSALGGLDIYVGYLDAPVTGITPFKILPSNWGSYLPRAQSNATRIKLPVLTKTAHKPDGTMGDQVSIINLTTLGAPGVNGSQYAIVNSPSGMVPGQPLATDAWYSRIIGGDSGGPVFAPINGEMTLFCAYHMDYGGPHYAGAKTLIDAAMNELATAAADPLAGTYAIQTASLVGLFTTYP